MRIRISSEVKAALVTIGLTSAAVAGLVWKANKDEKKNSAIYDANEASRTELLSRKPYTELIMQDSIRNDKLTVDQRITAKSYLSELYSAAENVYVRTTYGHPIIDLIKKLDALDIALDILENGTPEEVEAVLRIYEADSARKVERRRVESERAHELTMLQTEKTIDLNKAQILANSAKDIANLVASVKGDK